MVNCLASLTTIGSVALPPCGATAVYRKLAGWWQLVSEWFEVLQWGRRLSTTETSHHSLQDRASVGRLEA